MKNPYPEIFVTLDRTSFEFVSSYESLEFAIYAGLAFAIPLLVSQPQLLTGAIVNAFLIMAALHFKGWKSLPLVVLPSIAALFNGMLFGPFTIFLAYMLPFIWAGNFLLVYLFKKIHLAYSRNYWLSLSASVLAKSALIFGTAYILFSLKLVPEAFLTAMGLLQIATGLLGGVLAYALKTGYSHLLK